MVLNLKFLSQDVTVKCYSIEGNRQWLDGGAMFGNAPKTLWKRWVECDEQNRIPLACRGLLVKTETKTILFETGSGFFMAPKMTDRYGIEGAGHLLLDNLEKAGFKEGDVDYVILSHLHFDHAGGLVPVFPGTKNPDWEPLFPNARYVVGKKQFEHSLSPHPRDQASYIIGLSRKLQQSGRLVLIGEDQGEFNELKGLATFYFSDGHTPGMMHSILQGKEIKIFFAGDLIPGIPWVHLPIVMGYDRFAEQTINEKKVILEQAISENLLIFYTHDPNTAASRIRINDKGKYEAVDKYQELAGYSI